MFHRANPRKCKLVRISAGSNNRDTTVFLWEKNKFVSSANIGIRILDIFGKSLTYIRKSSGPSRPLRNIACIETSLEHLSLRPIICFIVVSSYIKS